MKKIQLCIVLIIFSFSFYASGQSSSLPSTSFEAVAGYSKHGSGDENGIVFGGGFVKYYSPKFFLNYNGRGTVNHSKHEIMIHNTTTGQTTDASVRFTTGGFQLGVNAGLSIARSPQHEFYISIGPFVRFQSASNGADGYVLYGPQTTGQPTYLVGYDNHTPQNTLATGGLLQFGYNYTFRNQLYLGVVPAFQTDTNGDAILHAAIVVGKRL